MQIPSDQLLVIFGASGDLTYRKLIPALYALHHQKLLPKRFQVLGVGRTPMNDAAFRSKMAQGIRKFSEPYHLDEAKVSEFCTFLSYHAMDPADAGAYPELKSLLAARQKDGPVNIIFYLSLLPSLFGTIAGHLAAVGLNQETHGFRRLIVEKPFGYDLESSLRLNEALHAAFQETQLYRIDHYLGKETVQNLLVLRFSNGILEPLWNRNYVHHVEITSAESLGVGSRGGYYEGAGALRDMLQNHLLQVVGFTAMEPPSSMDPDAIRNETYKVLQALKPIREEDVPLQVVRGQYRAAKVQGVDVPGYREEPGVDPQSMTETYVAVKFYIDNWRWGGVPFYIRTGKRMPITVTEVVVHFKPTPLRLFKGHQDQACCNKLIIRIQPDEGILLKVGMKQPGAGFVVKPVNLDFRYADLSDKHLPSAYERLLYDAMLGDSTLYARADAVEAAWRFVAPIQRVWAEEKTSLEFYPAGTFGPTVASGLIDDYPEGWHYPCRNLGEDGEYCAL